MLCCARPSPTILPVLIALSEAFRLQAVSRNSSPLETEPFHIRLFSGQSSWRKHQEEEQANSSRCRPLNRMFWRGISRRPYPTTISPIERLHCTVSEAANTDTISMTGCRQYANCEIR